MYHPFSLQGKTILVTGASSGIGRAVAIECSKMGAVVFLNARDEARLHETLAAMKGDGHQIIVADLTNEEAINTLVEQLPPLDGVVFAAGISMLKPIQVLSEKDIQTIFATNYTAPVMLTKTLAKKRKLNTEASLVFISSVSGNGNTATALSLYGSSKSALNSFAKYAALEFATKKIRCNTICPGRIETNLLQNQTMSQEDIEKDIAKYPLRRYGHPEEVAYAALYLLSDAAKWVTGTSLIIDGGRTLV